MDQSFFKFDCDHLVLDTLKMAEPAIGNTKTERAIVLRFYESCGGRAKVKVSCSSAIKFKSIHYCNILEDAGEEIVFEEDGGFVLDVKPFKIISVKCFF